MFKEKAIELAKEHAKDLGIKIVHLAGESLIKFAEHLMTANMTKTIKFDNQLDLKGLADATGPENIKAPRWNYQDNIKCDLE